MSNELDFTKPLEYVDRDGGVYPFELLTTKGRGKYPVVGYIGDETGLARLTMDGRLLADQYLPRLRNVEVKRKPREWYTWARDGGYGAISSIGESRAASPKGIHLAHGDYIVRVTEVLPEEE